MPKEKAQVVQELSRRREILQAAIEAFGGLNDRGERITLKDAAGFTVDTVRYADGGEWPQWADGGGSSLELIDASQDNRLGQAWDASDDSAKAVTRTYSYLAQHKGGEPELAICLLARGITIVDEVSIIGGGTTVADTPLVDAGETWKYLKGTAEPPADWKNQGFNDASWPSGAAGIGYGDNDDATVLTDMQNSYLTIYCRKTFNLADRSSVNELVLSVLVDDGFYAYLNGVQVASYNVASPAFNAGAAGAVPEPLVSQVIDISSFKNLLASGANTLAFQVHNAGLGSSDLSFNPRLLNRTTTITGGTEQMANGTFESNTGGWIIEGTHSRTGRTVSSPIAGSGSLKLIASGRGDNKVNRIETPDINGAGLNPLNLNEDLAISFKARWIVGSSSLLTYGYEHEMARSHRLEVPEQLGTPGQRNSATQRLIDQTGGSNLGPVITGVVQDPVVPGAGEAVKVRARVLDSDGIGSVSLKYSLNNPSTAPASAAMASLGGGLYEGTIPGQALNTRVVFFIAAVDSAGRAGSYPADLKFRTHPLVLNPASPGLDEQRYLIYSHDVRNPATNFFNYRFYMTQNDQNYLSNRRLLSNESVPGSFVFGGGAMYYEAHTRFAGSPWARAGWGGSFRVNMPRDRLLHGRIRKFNAEDHHGSGIDARERISHYLFRQQNGGGTVVPYSDAFTLVRWQVNNRVTGTREHLWVPDVDFISLWFPHDDDGLLYEMDDRFVIDDNGNRAGNTDGRALYPPPSSRSDGNGANQENYRWFFGLRVKNGLDDFTPLQQFARVMDPAATNNADFDAQIWSVCNVEEFLRYWAVEMNIDDWDTWGCSRGKNLYLYQAPIDGRMHMLGWDLELTYGSLDSFMIPAAPSQAFSPGGFGEVNRMVDRPAVKRLYYSILAEMVNSPNRWFHSSFLSPYSNELAAFGMSNSAVGQTGGWIDQKWQRLRDRIQTVVYPQVRLTITTNNGNPWNINQPAVNISGNAPVDVARILVNGDEHSTAFTGMTAWTVSDIPLHPGANVLNFLGYDMKGALIDSDAITVTTSVSWNPPAITSLNPSSALSGASIEILGTDFHNGIRVFFGTAESASVSFDENGPAPGMIVARVPAGSGAANVTARNLDNQTSNARPFNYLLPPASFLRGDANGSGSVDIADAVKILLYLFKGAAADCQDALDADDNEEVNITDAVYLLEFLLDRGPAIPAPYPAVGVDPSGAALGCSR